MTTLSPEAQQALQKSSDALRRKDSFAARRWAQRAVRLAPGAEEPWLMLATVSRPRARRAYLQQALSINPGSTRARQLLQRLPNSRQFQPVPPRAAGNRAKKASRAAAQWNLSIPAAVVFALVCLSLLWAAWPGAHSAARTLPGSGKTPLPGSATAEVAKPTSAPAPIPTSTPAPTPTALPDAVISAYIASTEGDSSAALPDTSGAKRILVSISQQHLWAYQGDTLIFSFVASTGMGNSTRVGTFSVLDKIPNAYGATWNIWMPSWLGIYYSGYLENGIHALPILSNGQRLWAGYLGTPVSFGCVVLGVEESQLLYDWATVGTVVQIER
jgi:hypothetical protein